MSTPEVTIRAAASLLGRFAYRYRAEAQLHDRLADVLVEGGFQVEREVVLDAENRADIVLGGDVVIEVKVDGTLQQALRQVGRYIDLDRVQGVLLVATPRWAAQQLRERPRWHDKPFGMVCIRRQAL